MKDCSFHSSCDRVARGQIIHLETNKALQSALCEGVLSASWSRCLPSNHSVPCLTFFACCTSLAPRSTFPVTFSFLCSVNQQIKGEEKSMKWKFEAKLAAKSTILPKVERLHSKHAESSHSQRSDLFDFFKNKKHCFNQQGNTSLKCVGVCLISITR